MTDGCETSRLRDGPPKGAYKSVMDEQAIQEILSGRRKTLGAGLLRALLAVAEPAYTGATSLRNCLYDRGILKPHTAGRPVVSVGNITTGGTGKTPMVRWLAERLAQRGYTPAVLMRGYKGRDGWSDEQQLLRNSLPDMPVVAQADRVAGARHLLREYPKTRVILLDDGFQHRRLARDFDLVLVDAVQPFGFARLLPRGLLRERLAGLARADAVVLTRSDLVPTERRRELEAQLHGWTPKAGIYRARHQLTGLRSPATSAAAPPDLRLDWLADQRWIAAAGIGNPAALEQQLRSLPGSYLGGIWFADHYAYDSTDIEQLDKLAHSQGAKTLVVTEKDWTKLGAILRSRPMSVGVVRLAMEIAFDNERGDGLIELLLARLERTASRGRSAVAVTGHCSEMTEP